MPTIFGKQVSTPVLVAVSVGGAFAIYYVYKQHKAASSASSASSPSAIDPVTGLPYSQDNTIDPLTGMSYLAEAQQYGSVQAAEQAVAASSAIDYSGAYGYGSSVAGTAGTLVPASTTQATTYASNAAWAQAAEAGLTDIGYGSTDVAAALGRYLGGLSLTSDQATIVQAAIAEYGPPPVGSFQVIMAPGTGSTGSGNSGNGTSGGGGTGTGGGSSSPPPTWQGPYPADQTGTVHSDTTGENGEVRTTNAGRTWTYAGVKPAAGAAKNQSGTVTSATTGLTAKVATSDGGLVWNYTG